MNAPLVDDISSGSHVLCCDCMILLSLLLLNFDASQTLNLTVNKCGFMTYLPCPWRFLENVVLSKV